MPTVDTDWESFVALGVNKGDLLQILEDYPYDQRIRERAGRTLLEKFGSELSVRELNSVIMYTAPSSVAVDVGVLVLERAQTKDDLAQVLICVEPLRLEAARRTLAQDPETHDLMRCLDIPDVADEALERLLSDATPRGTLLHILRFRQRFAPAVREYLARSERRVELTPQMEGMLALMREHAAPQRTN